MAAKKQTQNAPAKTGTALQPWEQELADLAKEAVDSASSTGGSSKKIGTRGGRFTVDGAEVPDNVLRCVILDFLVDVTYYEGDFDPDDITPPTASALGRDEKALVWADGSDPEYAGKDLKDSDVFQWGSADKGRGKAAKSRRRLLLISEGDLEDDISAAEVRRLMVPVTSGREWDAYVKQVATHRRPPCGVLTEISIHPHPKYQFELQFKMLGLVDDEYMPSVIAKRESIQTDLFTPYAAYDSAQEEEAPARGGGKAVARNAQARGAKPARGRR